MPGGFGPSAILGVAGHRFLLVSVVRDTWRSMMVTVCGLPSGLGLVHAPAHPPLEGHAPPDALSL